jgi:hypothetical protein
MSFLPPLAPPLSRAASRWHGRFDSKLTYHSFREVPSRKKKNRQWRGHSFCHDISRIRELCRSSQDLLVQVPRSRLPTLLGVTCPPFLSYTCLFACAAGYANFQQQQSQSNRGENQQNRPNSQGYGAAGGSNPSGGFPGGDLGGQPEGGDGQGYLYSGQGGHNGASNEY